MITSQQISWLVKNIWRSHIWTADKDMNESDLRSDVHYLGSSENKAWKKNSGLYGIWTHDLCDTAACQYRRNCTENSMENMDTDVKV